MGNHWGKIFTIGYMMKNVNNLNRKITIKDLPDILIGVCFAIILVGYLILKYIFPANPFIQKYTTGVWGVINAFLLIVLIGVANYYWKKIRQK